MRVAQVQYVQNGRKWQDDVAVIPNYSTSKDIESVFRILLERHGVFTSFEIIKWYN